MPGGHRALGAVGPGSRSTSLTHQAHKDFLPVVGTAFRTTKHLQETK
ncbi:hypothetical protein [Streptomyces atratus]|nr:hypothetical protein [Streptomyces atratus]